MNRTIAYVLVVAATTVGLLWSQHRSDSLLRKIQVQSCERGNVTRGYLLLRAREFTQTDAGGSSVTTRGAPSLFPIIDCADSRGRPVSNFASARYLQDLERRLAGP